MNYHGICQKCGQDYWGLYLKFLPVTKCVCGGNLEVSEVGNNVFDIPKGGNKNADNNKKQ